MIEKDKSQQTSAGSALSGFSLFNVNAIFKSHEVQIPLGPLKKESTSEVPFKDRLSEDSCKNLARGGKNQPGKSIEKQHATKSKVKHANRATIKEIIEDYQTGIPTQTEKMHQKMRSATLREKKTKPKGQSAKVKDQAQPNFGVSQEQTYFTPETTLVLKDGKPTIVENAIALPSFADKVHALQLVEKKPYKLNSMSFRSRIHTAKWTEQDTEKFYKTLLLFGCDFSLIARMFKDRTRVQIKNKFHREERFNPVRVEESLNLRKRKFRLFSSHLRDLKAISNHESEQRNLCQIEVERDSTLQNVRKDSVNSIVSVDSLDLGILNEIQEIINEEQGQLQGPIYPAGGPRQDINMLETKSESNITACHKTEQGQSLPKEGNNVLIERVNISDHSRQLKEQNDTQKPKNLFYL